MSQFPGISQAALSGWLNDGMEAINGQLGIDYPNSPVNRTMNVEYY